MTMMREDAGEHLVEREQIAEPGDRVADAFRGREELADQDADQPAADRDARAGDDVGQHARDDHLEVEVLLAAAERAHDVDQQPVDRAHAGIGVEDEGKDREQEDDDGLSRDADAEEHDHQRRQRDQRARIEHRHQRIERVADPHAPAHHDADRHADHHRRGEAVDERHRADREIAQQVAAREQIDEALGDQARLADEQRIERDDQKHRLPGGEEQRDRQARRAAPCGGARRSSARGAVSSAIG